MLEEGRGASVRRVLLALAATGLAAVGVGVALQADPDTAGHASARPVGSAGAGGGGVVSNAASPCGSATAGTFGAVDAAVASRIYTDELNGTETRLDIAHITGYRALLSALASNNQAAVQAAVHAIVYTPHWHIVRLRVTRGSRVLADVGGPYIIAPVSGTLRSNGRTVGRYVMSVQDDVGYVKLVTRFVGAPVDLYRNGSFLMGTLQPAPAAVADGAAVTVAGRAYQTITVPARAFPTGALQAALFVPDNTTSLAAQSCQAVRVAAWGSIAEHIAARLKPLQTHYQALADLLQALTGGRVYVRSGAKQLAGGAGPAKLPGHGSVRFAGRAWPVFSWEPVHAQRVYFLTPAG